jgi:hypothetical protein
MYASIIMNLFSLLLSSDKRLLFAVCLSIAIFVVCALMAIVFLVLIMMHYSNNQLLKNPVNKDTIAFEIIGACNIFSVSSKYPYSVIMWMMMANVLIVLIAIYLVFFGKTDLNKSITNSLKTMFSLPVAGVVILFAGFSLLVFGICFYFFMQTKSEINAANTKIEAFNNYLLNHMYFTDNNVLAPLRNIPSSSIDIINNIEASLHAYLSKKSSDMDLSDYGKLFFTYNLYQHYCQMGLINGENLGSTLENTFNTLNILKYFISLNTNNNTNTNTIETFEDNKNDIKSGTNADVSGIKSSIRVKNMFSDVTFTDWNAATSLMSKYTFIKDYSNQYIKLIQNTEITDKGNKISSKRIFDAANYSSNVCVNASEMANSFNLDKGLNSFITMAVFIAIVTVLPFILIWFLLSSNAGAILDATFKKDIYDTSISNIDVQGTKLTQLSKKVDSIMEKIKILNDSTGTKEGGSKLHKKKKGGVGEGETGTVSPESVKDEKYLDYVSTLESTVQEIEDIVNSMNDSVNTIHTIREDNDDLQEKIYAAEAAKKTAEAAAEAAKKTAEAAAEAAAEAQRNYDKKTKEIFAKLKVNTYITIAIGILNKIIDRYINTDTILKTDEFKGIKTEKILEIFKNIIESTNHIKVIQYLVNDKTN